MTAVAFLFFSIQKKFDGFIKLLPPFRRQGTPPWSTGATRLEAHVCRRSTSSCQHNSASPSAQAESGSFFEKKDVFWACAGTLFPPRDARTVSSGTVEV